jgi:hypothetical protein
MEPLHHRQPLVPEENPWPSIAAASTELRPRHLRASSPRPTRNTPHAARLGDRRERSSENNVEWPTTSSCSSTQGSTPITDSDISGSANLHPRDGVKRFP